MSSGSPPPVPQATSAPSVTSTTTTSSAQLISSVSGLNNTTITGVTVVSQPQLVVQTSTGKVQQQGQPMDDSQPVDLAAVKRPNLIPGVAPLKIPAVPLRPVPPTTPRSSVSTITFKGGQSVPSFRPSTIVSAVPKPGQMNLAVMQQQPAGNKMTVLQGPPATQKIISAVQANMQTQVSAPSPTQPRLATATTIIRTPQIATFPMTIRAPTSSPTTASIRLTSAGQTSTPMQFVPVSIGTMPMRPTGPVSVRPAPVGFRPSQGTIVRQAIQDTTISPVRVTLMQQPGGVKVGQTHSGPGPQAGFYKPVTITTQNPPTCMAPMSGPVRIGPIPSSRMAVVSAGTQNLTVSMTTPTSHINVPIAAAHNLITSKPQQQQQQQGMHARLPGNVSVPMVSGGGVTIQKASIPVSAVSRTIALPYGTSSSIVTSSQSTMASLSQSTMASIATSITTGKLIASSTTSTTTLSAIPVARVCPQPLAAVSSNNLVTISTSGTMTGGSSQDGSGVFITRTNTGLPLQQLAINLSTSGGNNQFQQQQQQTQQQQQSATTNNSKVRPSMNVVTHLNLPKINLPTQPARLLNYPGQQHQFMMSGPGGDISHHLMEQQQQQQQQRLPTNSPRPSILRRREGERELILAGSPASPPPRPDSRDDASSSSSGSTTLSATSSPGGAAGNLSGCDEPEPNHMMETDTKPNNLNDMSEQPSTIEPSPRKKPRKQQLARVREHLWSESEDSFTAAINEELRRKVPLPQHHQHVQQQQQQQLQQQQQAQQLKEEQEANYIRDKPRASLLSDYRANWKARHNHFLRHSDVKPKDERRPTVNELSNQKFVLQKVNGWKVYHLTSQMEDIIDIEAELTQRLSELQRRLEKAAHPEIAGKEVSKTQELIKANLQRSKVIQDQMSEARENAVEIFEHKPKIISIIHKYESKRHVKKRFEHK